MAKHSAPTLEWEPPAPIPRLIPLPAFPMFHLEHPFDGNEAMKVRNSLKSLAGRHRGNRLVRRNGRMYVINKLIRRYKARQG